MLTKYGGAIWVKRHFETKELLAAADVPEKLIHLSLPHEVELLVEHVFCPIKVLQTVAEALEDSLKREGDGRKRQREIDVTEVTTAAKRVHLGLTAIEESVLAADLDATPLENHRLDGRDDHDGNEHQAKAVKRDDASVRVHDWDFFLALGLAEEIPARPCREAAKIIRSRLHQVQEGKAHHG